MNKNTILLLAVLVIILLGAGGFFLYSKNAKPAVQNQNVQNATPTPANPTGSASSSSLLDIVAAGGNQECTFSYKGENADTSSGTFYISGQNSLRGDFSVTSAGKKSDFSIIRNGEENYLWGPQLNPGIKLKLSLEELGENQAAGGYLDPNLKTDYSCKPWTIDVTKFAPPTTVEFTDLSSFIPSPSGN